MIFKLSKLWTISAVLFFLALGLGPVVNLFSKHKLYQPASTDAQFDSFSVRLQTSCSDCHTPGAAIMPLYANFPIVNGIVRNDITDAQAAFILSPQNLTGEIPLSPMQLNKMQAVLHQNYMPPKRYLAMHWNAIIPKAEKKALLDWIEKHDPNFNSHF